MTSITPNLAADAKERTEARDAEAAAAADAGPFVLNLCSSTTPMALPQADLAELKRFTFFVSRRFEEGRERFRLHMGYFTTLAEAEEWLSVVREIYPGAWAGEAPGKKLRARAAAAAAAQAQHALGPMPRSALPNAPSPSLALAPTVTSPHVSEAPTPAARSPEPARSRQALTSHPVEEPVELAARAPVNVPTLHAAPPVSAAPIVSSPVVSPPVVTPPIPKAASVRTLVPVAKATPTQIGAPAAKPVVPRTTGPVVKAASTVSAPAARAQNAGGQVRAAAVPNNAAPKSAPAAAGAKVSSRAESSRTPAQQPHVRLPVNASTAASKSRSGTGKSPSKGNAFADSNVREVLAALDDTSETGQTRMMPTPQIPQAETQDTLTDTQVLRYLETRRSDDSGRGPGQAGEGPETNISLLKPDDTGTRRALKDAITHDAPVAFAVQLQWSVQPVELNKVPPLAIFSAYTLYTVAGSREGRKWYGLRLGFFSDAVGAKQVAHYVRSEFASVAVVPVSPQEKARATTEEKNPRSSLAFPRKTRQESVDEFKLIDSDDDVAIAPAVKAALQPTTKPTPAAAPAALAARSKSQPPAGKRSPSRGGGRVNAHERRRPQTLEETLEILGASELEIDNGSGETLNDTGVRHLRVEVQKNTPFSRLLERLSERTKKNS